MAVSVEHKISRKFRAPRAAVWQAFTDPVHLAQWYGPTVDTVIHAFEFKPGGVWRHEMKMGERSSFSQMIFQEITDREAVSWYHTMTDEDWNPAPHPMMPDWPKEVLNRFSFADDRGDTKIEFTQIPVDPSEAQKQCFANMVARMDAGWRTGFDIIDAILSA